ncbi:unnamed protein product [Gongylonema pulchrum]|uniref:Succinate dehydrogenase assembly factor 4, mitochondrial n=1 Tax=Gongylonema pulchrum TaxID=637853 RepID=A0A183EAD4_9BILA|nr:unnamed protein product [Gongylonema pulchrum]
MFRLVRYRTPQLLQCCSKQCVFAVANKGSLSEKEIEILKKKTPKGKLDRYGEEEEERKPYEDPALPRHPGGVNPLTGEIGGPAGPEPTRYGDWERKGRCIDF